MTFSGSLFFNKITELYALFENTDTFEHSYATTCTDYR